MMTLLRGYCYLFVILSRHNSVYISFRINE